MIEKATILLAEDDPDDVLLTNIALRKARLANPLQVVRDGEEALMYLSGEGKFANREQYPLPILLLLDLNMPKVNGFQVLAHVRSTPASVEIPILVITVDDTAETKSRAIAANHSHPGN